MDNNSSATSSSKTIEVMPEGYNQYDLTFKVIVIGNAGI
jgi:hypothetical protein